MLDDYNRIPKDEAKKNRIPKDEAKKIWERYCLEQQLGENMTFIAELLSTDEKNNKFILEDRVRAGRLLKAINDLTKAADDFNGEG